MSIKPKIIVNMKSFDNLVLEFPRLDEKKARSLQGGSDYYWDGHRWAPFSGNGGGSHTDNYYGGTLHEVTVTPHGNYYDLNPYDVANPGSYGTGFFAGGSSGNSSSGADYWSDPVSNPPSGPDELAFALAHVSMWSDIYLAADGVKPVQEFAHIFADPISQLKGDLAQGNTPLRGIAMINIAGKVLGYTSAVNSVITLGQDILDDDGKVNPIHVADALVSCGSLFIKSSPVGFAVSMGWLLIKAQYEE